MFMFASYGVQLFGGKLARCNDPAITRRVSATLTLQVLELAVLSYCLNRTVNGLPKNYLNGI